MLRDDLVKCVAWIKIYDLGGLEGADRILALLAPELEKSRLFEDTVGNKMFDIETLADKARKWDRVKEIATLSERDKYPCDDCPIYEYCDTTIPMCAQAEMIVDALEGEK